MVRTLQELVAEMMDEVHSLGQSSRRLSSPDRGRVLRQALRREARRSGTRLRTAQTDDVIVAARLDASVWTDRAVVMRAKLAPPVEAVELG